MITSTSNARVKWVRNLQNKRALRESENAFIIEGRRLLQEARSAGSLAKLVLYAGDLDPSDKELVDALLEPGAQCAQVTEHVLKACSATEAPQGVLAVLNRPAISVPSAPALILVLDKISDPGNLGTIMRSARAAGVKMLYLLPGGVDIYNPKVVRAAAGAHFHLPVQEIFPTELAEALAGVPLWIGDAHKGQVYHCIDWTRRAALGIGSESHGHSPQLAEIAAGFVRIPMKSGTESLNAGVAAAIILFEIARQRGTPCKSEH